MEAMDRLHMIDPSAGSRRMYKYLRRLTGKKIGRERVRRLMRIMGIEAVYPRKRITIPWRPSTISPYRRQVAWSKIMLTLAVMGVVF